MGVDVVCTDVGEKSSCPLRAPHCWCEIIEGKKTHKLLHVWNSLKTPLEVTNVFMYLDCSLEDDRCSITRMELNLF